MEKTEQEKKRHHAECCVEKPQNKYSCSPDKNERKTEIRKREKMFHTMNKFMMGVENEKTRQKN